MNLDSEPSTTQLFNEMQQSDRTLSEHCGISASTLTVIYAKAVSEYESENLAEASKILWLLTTLDPGSEDAWILLGNVFMKLGQTPNALLSWEMALVCVPRFSTAAMISRIAMAICMWDKAAEHVLKAKSLKRTESQSLELDDLIDKWYQGRDTSNQLQKD